MSKPFADIDKEIKNNQYKTDAHKPLPDKITEKAIKELRQERYWQGQPIWEFQAAMQIQDIREKAIAQRLKECLKINTMALNELDERFSTGAEVPIELRVLKNELQKLIEELEKVK